MSERVYNVLFVCRDNSACSLMAEALLNHHGRHRFRAFSAGSHPTGQVSQRAIDLLERAGLPTKGLRSKSWDEFAQSGAPPLDFVFTLFDEAYKEPLPAFAGEPMTAHWGMSDPAAAQGPDIAVAKAFHNAYMALDWRIGLLVSLPLSKLDELTVARKVAEIGRS